MRDLHREESADALHAIADDLLVGRIGRHDLEAQPGEERLVEGDTR